MCNRYAFEDTAEALAAVFGATAVAHGIGPCYNVAPSSRADHRRPVIVPGAAGRSMVAGYFGFDGVTARGRGVLHLNAKSETVRRLPSFAEHARERRCLVPATAFYEFDPAHNPYAYRVRRAPVFAFAAIHAEATHRVPGPRFCLLTAPGCEAMTEIGHPRMPLIVEPGDEDAWLIDGEIPAPLPADRFTRWRVSRRLNGTAAHYANDPSLLEPIEEEPDLFG